MSQVSDIANTILEGGRVRAQGAANRGAILGGSLAQLGQTIAQIPQQRQQQRMQDQEMHLRSQEMQIRQGQVDTQQRQQATEAAWNNAVASSLNPDHSLNLAGIEKAVQGNPSLVPHWKALQDGLLATQEHSLKVLEAQSKLQDAQAAHASSLAHTAEAAPDAETKAATLLVGLVQGGQSGSIDPKYAKQMVGRLLSDTGTPDPQNVDTVIAQMKQVSSEELKRRADAAHVQAETNQIGKPKPITNEAELAADAANPNSPTREQSAAAIATLQKPAMTNAARASDAQAETARHNKAEEAIARARENRESAATGDDAKVIADAIVSGDQPPTVAGLYRYAAPVRAELARQGYNFTTANLDWEATKKHLSTLNGAQQTRLRQAITTASDSLGVIEDLAKQWDGGKFPLLNKATLAAARNGAMGPQAQQIATNLTAQITDVTSELGNVYMGGNSPTDHALQLAGKNLSADWTRDQLLSAIKLARTNLTIRNNSILNSGAITSSGNTPAGATAKDPLGLFNGR